jgi:hypothetical protein
MSVFTLAIAMAKENRLSLSDFIETSFSKRKDGLLESGSIMKR